MTASIAIEIRPTNTPAADLPAGMTYDVLRVLEAHGLQPEPLAVQQALYRLIVETPSERGGRA